MRVKREERVLPTEQTVAKLASNVITDLWSSEVISQEQETAAWEIARIRHAVARGLNRTSHLDNSRSSRKSEPIDAMTGYEAQIYSKRYLPWQTQEARAIAFGKIARLEIVMKVCADNWSRESIAEFYSGSLGDVTTALRDSLDAYVRFMETVDVGAKV